MPQGEVGAHEDLDREVVHAVLKAERLEDVDPGISVRLKAQDIKKRLDKLRIPVKHADGHIEHVVPKWRDAYKDEYPSDNLPHEHICEAMAGELA